MYLFAVVPPVRDGFDSCSAVAQLIRCGELRFLRCWTCTTSPHSALLISRLLIIPVCVWLSLSLSLSQETQAGPAEEEYMSQSSGHHSGPAEPQPCTQCQCSQPGWAHTALPELLRSVSVPACLHVFPKFVMCLYSLSQPGYINEGWGRVKGGIQGERNWQGGGGQRAGSYNQALFCWAAEAN